MIIQKYYTGIGSRETPMHIYILMIKISMVLERKGFILRSGTAIGADSAFEQGISSPLNAEIYIPYSGFEKKMGKYNSKIDYIVPKNNKKLFYEANNLMMSKDLYKRWKNVKSDWVIALHNRNIFQILGQDLKTKANFCVCYTKCGSTRYEQTNPDITGGTGTAINAADRYGIPVFNLKRLEDKTRLLEFVEKNDFLIDYKELEKIKPISKIFNKDNRTILQLCNDKRLKPKDVIDLKILSGITINGSSSQLKF
jgi:hypothetical protein